MHFLYKERKGILLIIFFYYKNLYLSYIFLNVGEYSENWVIRAVFHQHTLVIVVHGTIINVENRVIMRWALLYNELNIVLLEILAFYKIDFEMSV